MLPPNSLWLFTTTPPRPVRPVYDIPPVITRQPRWRWLRRRRLL
jgi:hypothetical protein